MQPVFSQVQEKPSFTTAFFAVNEALGKSVIASYRAESGWRPPCYDSKGLPIDALTIEKGVLPGFLDLDEEPCRALKTFGFSEYLYNTAIYGMGTRISDPVPILKMKRRRRNNVYFFFGKTNSQATEMDSIDLVIQPIFRLVNPLIVSDRVADVISNYGGQLEKMRVSSEAGPYWAAISLQNELCFNCGRWLSQAARNYFFATDKNNQCRLLVSCIKEQCQFVVGNQLIWSFI